MSPELAHEREIELRGRKGQDPQLSASGNPYHFNAKVCQRSLGQTSVAQAAYRAGEKLKDELTGEIHDYTKKRGVIHCEILTPKNAPEWMKDRQQLWSGVELAEKRKDAQCARTFTMSLPHELTNKQRLEYTREFMKAEFTSRGMIVDFAIHDQERGNKNFHVHAMVTMREIAGGKFGKKKREWNDVTVIKSLRERWSSYTNQALENAGHVPRFDHRTLKEQGIEREPTVHLGPTANEMERQGKASELGDKNRAVKEINSLSAEFMKLDIEANKLKAEIIQIRDYKTKTKPEKKPGPEQTQQPAINDTLKKIVNLGIAADMINLPPDKIKNMSASELLSFKRHKEEVVEKIIKGVGLLEKEIKTLNVPETDKQLAQDRLEKQVNNVSLKLNIKFNYRGRGSGGLSR